MLPARPRSSKALSTWSSNKSQKPRPPGRGFSFAVNEGVTVYLDESLRRFETVFPACGSSNSAIELTISQLEQLSRFTGWVDVCRRAVPAAVDGAGSARSH